MTKPKTVIGTYKCGCSYGPIRIKQRLEYCSIHGDEIQNEYEYISWFLESDKNNKVDTESINQEE